MPRGTSYLPNDHVEAASNLRAKAHRARLFATGILNEQAAKGLRDYADELEAQAAALEPPQVIPPEA
jgi:hypothetical protein